MTKHARHPRRAIIFDKLRPYANPSPSPGIAHPLPPDLRKALSSNPKALAAWEGITPLARNEWICWTISVKKAETRKEHVERAIAEQKKASAGRAAG